MTTAIPIPIIPGYKIREKLYSGVRTLVYRATRESDSLAVVIKLLASQYPNFHELLQFRNQYIITKNLNMTGIVHPLSLEAYGNGYILVMEDSGGISLREYIKNTTLSIIEFLAVAIQLTNTLACLHQNSVIHKDIKPANILINPESKQVKLIDFSIASLLPKEIQEIKNPNVLEGSLAYISPEQTGRMNRGIDYRSDFYSLGVTFYELLTGELPFISDDPIELVHCHIAQLAACVYDIKSDIPQVISEIIEKLMAKNAEDRYQSALGLKHDLEKCMYQLKDTGKVSYFQIAKRDLWDRFIIPEKLYGREREAEQLLAAFARVSDTDSHSQVAREGRAELILVAGFSGIGKTAVVNEIHKPIVKQRGYFIKGKFDQFNRNIPFSAFVQAFRDLIGQLLSESDAKLQEWKSKILQALGENGQVIIEVIPELERIIGKQPSVPELSGTSAQNRFNLLLHKFLQVFTTKEHPLVIFLDDLQWADSASLKLIQLLTSSADSKYLLLIGAYRDNEVFAAHPLMLTLSSIKKAQTIINTITLTPLSEFSLNKLVADTLSCLPEIAQPLTQLIYQKTQGNPFFSRQFIKALYEDKLIKFNIEGGNWECDITKVKALALTDDVVEFMATQLQKLPTVTQDILKLAACIGNNFDLGTLAIISQQSEYETATALWKALQSGFVLPQSQLYKFYIEEIKEYQQINNSQVVNYRFLHDRIQQAAYSLIPSDKKQATHFQIGQLLLKKTTVAEQDEKIFDIVNQLNYGVELITKDDERLELARLNFLAGNKAKASTAYTAATEYATLGIKLLKIDPWQTQYELTLALHNLAAETAYLAGDFELMEEFFKIVLQRAKNTLDKVKVYDLKIQVYGAKSKPEEAVNTALSFLKLLSVDLPDNPSQFDVQMAMEQTKSYFVNRDIQDLINLPDMLEAQPLAAMYILSSAIAMVYTVDPNLFILMTLKQIELSVKYGNAPLSAFAYTVYGFIICGVQQDIESGYKFGELGISLSTKLSAKEVSGKTILTFNGILKHWKKHVREILKPLLNSYSLNLSTGNLEFAALSAYFYCNSLYFLGHQLTSLREEILTYSHAIQQIKQHRIFFYNEIYRQVVLNLLDQQKDPCRLIGEAYNEENMLPLHIQNNDGIAILNAYFCKLQLCYLFENYQEAVENAAKGEQYLYAGIGKHVFLQFHFYYSLGLLALYPHSEASVQEKIREKVVAYQEKMLKWAHHAPMNSLHKFYLVSAERNRILGEYIKAIELYDQSIAGAKENGYIQEEALANELTAKFYLNWGREKAAAGYMQEAYYCYARWGASSKIAYLEEQYPQLLTPILQSPQLTIIPGVTIASTLMGSVTSKSSNHNSSLDFTGVMKAAQAVSQEIELDKLLATLMQIAITSAGAQIGSLILQQDSQWLVVAQVNKQETKRLEIPLDQYQDIPQSLIYSVARQGEVAVFENFSESTTFAGEPYIITHKPKSVLCTPISQQGKLIGILYLENSLTTGVFTSDRLQMIQILTAQAAISLENAQLYRQLEDYSHTLEQKVEQRTQQLTEKATQLELTLKQLYSTQAQLIQSEKMSSLGQLVAGVAHEINNPVSFIHGNLTYVEEYTTDLLQLLNIFKEDLLNKRQFSSLKIQELLDEVDLDFVGEDLPKILKSMKIGTERISDIVLSLRNFSRMDEAEFKAVDIHSGINSVLMILQHRLQEKVNYPNIQIIKDYSKLPEVECYVGQLNQVFMNILTNAIDAIESKNSQQTIESIKNNPSQIIIRTSVMDSNYIKIAIADNGIGMTNEVQKQIFNPFFTTKPVGSGTGMGLSISYQIIEKHHGNIQVNSAIGQGTEFIILLPLAKA